MSDNSSGHWHQVKGEAQRNWDKLSTNDLEAVAGERQRMVGKIQERYGVTHDEAERQVKEWERRQNYRW